MAINNGPHARARLWSQAIYDSYPTVEGLWYCSSMDANRPAIALYERAISAMPTNPEFHRALGNLALTSMIKRSASRFGYVVI